MPSRNSVPNAAEPVSRSESCTRLSPARSAMVNALNATGYSAGLDAGLMMNKSLRASAGESSGNREYGFQPPVVPGLRHPSRLLPTWTLIMPNSGKPEFGRADSGMTVERDGKKRAAVSGGF